MPIEYLQTNCKLQPLLGAWLMKLGDLIMSAKICKHACQKGVTYENDSTVIKIAC